MSESCFRDQNPADAVRYSLREHGGHLQLAEHFRLVEFACRDGSDEVLVHPALVLLLERLRRRFGQAVHVTSGYRTVAHNRAVGGARRSQHLLGMAADIVVRGLSPSQVARAAREAGAGGVGLYASFVHVDVGPSRTWQG